MTNIAIKVENLSKAYQLGEIGTGTISRDLERWWAKFRGKEDPFLKIGQTNDRTAPSTSLGANDVVWSLKDINFEIEQGQAVGIIGRNGAGKSTLLKILSRVTSPTTGNVKLKGRVASLLEVGTGFHPELTGRENIYLNGAILGMRKAEIKRKFDEIVDFAGVEKYIDTPVKRYSSGMYVRLAFAVAAHLESEILIVDEVLAVGDAEFQKKCLGKMNDVSSKEGRTVLFVSHNMGAVRNLCTSGIILENGKLKIAESIDTVISNYVVSRQQNEKINLKLNGNIFEYVIPQKMIINGQDFTFQEIMPKSEIKIQINFQIIAPVKNFTAFISFYKEGIRIFSQRESDKTEILVPSEIYSEFKIDPYTLRPGVYDIAVGAWANNETIWCWELEQAQIKIIEAWDDFLLQNDEGFVNMKLKTSRSVI